MARTRTLTNNITSGTQRTTHHHHHHHHRFLFTAATQSNTRQSFATRSVVNKRVNTFIETLRLRCNKKATQYCPQTVDIGLCSVRSLGAHSEQCSFIKFVELYVLRLQSIRIEVITVPLGVHVHGDPMFSRLIGIMGVADDCPRVRVHDFWQTVFGNDIVRAQHRVAR